MYCIRPKKGDSVHRLSNQIAGKGWTFIALRHQEQEGHIVHPVESQSEGIPQGQVPFLLPSAHERLLEALTARDLAVADQVLGEALALSSPEELILDVIAPAMSDIGEGWEAKKITVAIEHLATNYLRQRLLMWMLSGPPARWIRRSYILSQSGMDFACSGHLPGQHLPAGPGGDRAAFTVIAKMCHL